MCGYRQDMEGHDDPGFYTGTFWISGIFIIDDFRAERG